MFWFPLVIAYDDYGSEGCKFNSYWVQSYEHWAQTGPEEIMKKAVYTTFYTTFCAVFLLSACSGVKPHAQVAAGPLPPERPIPKIFYGTGPNDLAAVERDGYRKIGASRFFGEAISKNSMIKTAQEHGADLVLYSSEYKGTRQTVAPLTQYNPGQNSSTYTYGTTIVGNSVGSYSGTAVTTSPGTYSTQWVPVSQSEYYNEALFFKKGPPPSEDEMINDTVAAVVSAAVSSALSQSTNAAGKQQIQPH